MGIQFGRGEFNKQAALVALAADEKAWAFEVGQCVTHMDQPLPSLVLSRTRGGPHEFYGLRSFLENDNDRDRLMLGTSLRHADPGTDDCATCLLRNTGLCPGDRN